MPESYDEMEEVSPLMSEPGMCTINVDSHTHCSPNWIQRIPFIVSLI